ncbi:MAG TPA: energy transducer TonB [Steroidobacteraceae bacterium]|nr:energy transducer TonB [Steroidobacteraceae bacterium]
MASAPSTASRSSETAKPATGNASAQPAVDVTAVTTRDDFLLELGQALEGQAGIRPVDTIEAALEGLSGGKRAQLLVIDARAVINVRGAVDMAAAKAPRALTLVFAEQAAEKQVGAALKGSKVFAVLPDPLDPRKTRAVFDGAIAEAVAARAAAPTREAPAPADFRLPQPLSAPARREEDSGARSKLPLIAAVVAALAAAAGAYWYFAGGKGGAAPAPTPKAALAPAPAAVAAAAAPADAAAPEALADTSIVHGKVDELLEKARAAMHERRFTEPAGDNALLYYRSAAAADASNGEARDGLQRVAGVLAGRFEDALNGSRFEEAAQTLANFKAATPSDPRVPAFEQRLYAAEIARALADGNLDRAAALVRQAQASGSTPAEQLAKWRADIARRVDDAKVTRLAGLVEDRIREGRLTDPDDSAKIYMAQLAAAAAASPITQRTQHDLGTAYLRKARDAALAKNSAEEERWLNEARGVGMKQADILGFQRDLSNARAKAAQAENDRTLQMARDRIHDGRLTDPAQDSAAYYLTQLQTSDPANAGLADAGHELSAKLLERARGAAAAGKPVDADLALARRFGGDPKEIATVQQLASAPKSPAALDPAVLAAGLKRLRAPPPDYPENAMNQHIAGSVMLTFTVDVKGEPRDIHVVEAQPPGVFDRAAITAIRRWRYAPTVINGTAVEVPVRTLVRFELPK